MNGLELVTKESLEKEGFRVLRNGWPDFAVLDEYGHLRYALEVKSREDQVKRNQLAMHRVLRDLGVDVRIVRPSDLGTLLEEVRAVRDNDRAKLKRLRLAMTMMREPLYVERER